MQPGEQQRDPKLLPQQQQRLRQQHTQSQGCGLRQSSSRCGRLVALNSHGSTALKEQQWAVRSAAASLLYLLTASTDAGKVP
jgi:hypothetical protein